MDYTKATDGQMNDQIAMSGASPAAAQRMSRPVQSSQPPCDTGGSSAGPGGDAAPASYPDARDSTPNIIIFGETGVGKSSLINMIVGTDSAATSNEAIGCTFQSTPYGAVLRDRKYRIWDTIGLNEGDRGTASADASIENLHKLVENLKGAGVSLLVYCIRGARIRDIIKINYDLFHKVICDQHVAIALVVTGLENEENMDDWWENNAEDFARRGMQFSRVACGTTTKGKLTKNGEYMFEEEYNLSVKRVRELIMNCCPEVPWKPDGTRWPDDIVERMDRMFLQHESQGRPQNQSQRRSQSENQARTGYRGQGYGPEMLERHRAMAIHMPDFLVQFFQYIVMFASGVRRS